MKRFQHHMLVIQFIETHLLISQLCTNTVHQIILQCIHLWIIFVNFCLYFSCDFLTFLDSFFASNFCNTCFCVSIETHGLLKPICNYSRHLYIEQLRHQLRGWPAGHSRQITKQRTESKSQKTVFYTCIKVLCKFILNVPIKCFDRSATFLLSLNIILF